MTRAIEQALTALAPRHVILDGAAPALRSAIVAWVAAQTDVAVSRGATAPPAPGALLVTGDAVQAAGAVAAGVPVVLEGDPEAVELPAGWQASPLDDAAYLLAEHAAPHRAAVKAPAVAVIVPIHNAAAELERCLDALSRNTTLPAELVLVDDASTDPAIAAVLETVEPWPHVRVLRNARNMGFTATVNRGLRAVRGDAVVLNSDTEVGPRWLERLRDAAYRDPRTGSATACSDNAGAFSLPAIGEANPVPLHLDADGAATLVAQAAGGALAATPTANGFCMYLRRAMLDDVGLLDEEAFPRGYGEENDLSMRAIERGWTHAVDPGTFVHHAREASFGAEKAALAAGARAVVDARHPGYTAAVREFVADPVMRDARGRVAAAFSSPARPRPRVLYVIHEGGGGTPQANFELMAGISDRYECLLLTCDRLRLRLDRIVDGERVPLERHELASPTRVLDFTREDYRLFAERVLREWAIDLVHVRHLFKHTFDVPVLAERMGIPVVFSFHDYYFTCPTVHLLDDDDRYCAGVCTPGDGACRVPDAGLEGLPHLKHAFVHQWREEVSAMLAGVDAFATTSDHVRDVHRTALPAIAGRPFAVIAHGRSLPQLHGLNEPPEPGGPLRVLVAGNLAVHKGADYLREIRAADRDGRIELHFIGDVPAQYSDLGVVHGRYPRDELVERVRAIRPAVMGLFSITAETFSHTITEAWSMGLPVVATDLGAPAERLRAHEGGWLVPHDDAEEAVRRLVAIADDPGEYTVQARRADLRGCDGAGEMADGYAALYADVRDRRRSLCAPAVDGAGLPRHAHGTRRLTAIVSGSDGVHPGSTYVRIVQRYRHPALERRVTTRVRHAGDGPVPADAEMVLVQRTAIPPERIDVLLAEVEARGLPLVVDLDDHLLLKGVDDAAYAPHQASLARLLEAAALVTVSTSALADVLRDGCRQVAGVPNALDERLFLDGVEGPPRGGTPPDGPVRIVYAGSPTHAADLTLLQPVMAELERRAPGRFVLDVVGVQPPEPGRSWFDRTVIPNASKPYPRFVRWLREQRPRWAIGVAPLVDTSFNRHKSDLKWLEYTGLGLPVVASAREPYATIADGVTGRVVEDDPAAWADALQELAGDPANAERMVEAAWNEVTTTRLLRHGSDRLLDLLLGLPRS